MTARFDDAVIGAGILGLAHAYHLAKAGRRVLVLEKNRRAVGASIRNFGMLWPIGQPAGPLRQLALRSLETWQTVLEVSGLWYEPSGSLHLAYREDEAQVLEEFARAASGSGIACVLLTPRQVLEMSHAIKPVGLRAGLWSPTETCVDPREVIANLPGWLAQEYGVRFQFGAAVTGYDPPRVLGGGKEWTANRLWVCTGDDLHTLYPDVFVAAGLVPCKLQMMRSQAYGTRWRLGPMLAAGLTLRHYPAFATCSTLAALRKRVAEEMPLYDRYGIHVLVAQNGQGEVVIGDSHEYGDAIEPFDKREIDDLILDYLDTFLDVPDLKIAARWHGTYAKHPTQPYLVAYPATGVTVVTGVGGAGMTLSFGLAEQVVREVLGED